MAKYIEDQIAELKKRKNGIVKNADKWVNMPIKDVIIDAMIKTLGDLGKSIEDSVQELQQRRDLAHKEIENQKKTLDQIDNFAYALHADSSEKLNEYGLSAQAQKGGGGGSKRLPIPAKVVIESITDDDDGVGFIVRLGSIDDVEHFEVQRGQSEDPKALVLPPPYPFLRTVKKLKFTDDDIEKGQRYFYRVRAINRSGAGEWSEALSRVQ